MTIPERPALSALVLAALLLAGRVCSAAVMPQVEAGLQDFRHGRFAEALAEWEQAARAGDPRGALYVGVLYDSGIGVPRDYRQAVQWYRQAAADGSAVAAFNIGVMYDGGFGVAADQAEAAAWYEKAAAAGFARAQYNLALLYESGSGVPLDRERAAELYRSAAQHGISAASEHLAAMREPGERFRHSPHEHNSRRKDTETASRETEAAKGEPDNAMHAFEHAQQVLLTRGAADAGRAARLFRRAAEGHNAVAEYDLGYCYEHGLGVTANPAKAASWYRRAASDAQDDALRNMAQTSANTVAQPGLSN